LESIVNYGTTNETVTETRFQQAVFKQGITYVDNETTVVFEGLPPGTYRISELTSLRYDVAVAATKGDDPLPNGNSVTVDANNNNVIVVISNTGVTAASQPGYITAIFTNEKTHYSYLSDTDIAVNKFQPQALSPLTPCEPDIVTVTVKDGNNIVLKTLYLIKGGVLKMSDFKTIAAQAGVTFVNNSWRIISQDPAWNFETLLLSFAVPTQIFGDCEITIPSGAPPRNPPAPLIMRLTEQMVLSVQPMNTELQNTSFEEFDVDYFPIEWELEGNNYGHAPFLTASDTYLKVSEQALTTESEDPITTGQALTFATDDPVVTGQSLNIADRGDYYLNYLRGPATDKELSYPYNTSYSGATQVVREQPPGTYVLSAYFLTDQSTVDLLNAENSDGSFISLEIIDAVSGVLLADNRLDLSDAVENWAFKKAVVTTEETTDFYLRLSFYKTLPDTVMWAVTDLTSFSIYPMDTQE
ncbi:MAG: hypothetical protein LBS84_08535, partial [Clostridiales bacterium]|jgi:hypothetical protein|nr:hypothetical protein [Clostridiales bacterium]